MRSPHIAASVCQFLTPKNVTTPYHPQYSPDVSPPDYFLFLKLKIKLKGLHFADVAEVQQAVSDELKKVQKEEISAAFQKLYDRAEAYRYAKGAYFELKKRYESSSCVFDETNISPKTFGPHCMCVCVCVYIYIYMCIRVCGFMCVCTYLISVY